MLETVFVRFIAEKSFGVRIAELLHGHRVYLRNIRAYARIVDDGLMSHCAVARESVTELVRKHFHIKYGVVEAAENKRRLVIGQGSHIYPVFALFGLFSRSISSCSIIKSMNSPVSGLIS